ncbi:MAG: hypothetical protein B6D55_02430 [Candidatus Omnitrophica bacterium 4484_70.2]|nr:MAG: hypothetical protein B6D55_02430 [Candidatus Omnitrophica bacterium 4484_70.2]
MPIRTRVVEREHIVDRAVSTKQVDINKISVLNTYNNDSVLSLISSTPQIADRVKEKEIFLDGSESATPENFAFDGEYVYLNAYIGSDTYRLYKINPFTLQVLTYKDFSKLKIYFYHNEYIYGFQYEESSAVYLVKIKPDNLSITSKILIYGESYNGIGYGTFDGTYIYGSLYTGSDWKIYKLNINTGEIEKTVASPSGSTMMGVTHDGTYLYYTYGYGNNCNLYKLKLSDLSLIQTVNIPLYTMFNSTSLAIRHLCFTGDAIFGATTESGGSTRVAVIKFDIDNLNNQDYVQLPDFGPNVADTTRQIIYDGEDLYILVCDDSEPIGACMRLTTNLTLKEIYWINNRYQDFKCGVYDGTNILIATPTSSVFNNKIAILKKTFLPYYVSTYHIITVTDDYSVSKDNCVILADASSGHIWISLPSPSEVKNKKFYIKKIDSSSNTVEIDISGGSTIDGSTSVTLSTQYERIEVISDGEQYWRLD